MQRKIHVCFWGLFAAGALASTPFASSARAQTPEESKKAPEIPSSPTDSKPESSKVTGEPAPAPSVTEAPSADTTSGAARDGEVIGRDVYVRSGDSLNHYTICKLAAGDKVKIVGERGDWYEIAPPEGTFSLVSGDYVDTSDNQTGKINGDNVRVRAGSLLNENKYTVQTLMTRGADVTILGRNPDGFLRIKPPQGATLWINRNYVAVTGEEPRKPSNSTAATNSVKADGEKTAAPEKALSNTPADVAIAAPTTIASPTRTVSALSTSNWRKQLDELETQARAEAVKPAAERNFAPISEKLQPIAAQKEDQFASQFAQRRLDQIQSMSFLSDAIKKVRELDNMSESKRREFLAARATIPEPTIPIPSGIEVQGELRASAVYPPGSPNARYRLIDPAVGAGKTLGYVEIPSSLNINIQDYLGQRVTVRASEMRPQKGSVEPIPNYVAREIILIDSNP